MKFFLFLTFLCWGMFFSFSSPVQAAATDIPCSPGDRNQGLVSGGLGSSGFIGNPTGQCVLADKAAFAAFKVPSYSELKSLYFTQNKNAVTTLTFNATSTPACSGGTITLKNLSLSPANGKTMINSQCTTTRIDDSTSGNTFSSTPQTVIVFVENDLNIDSDLNYGSSATSGLILIVKGNIYIAAAVKNINAVLVSEGNIYTSGTTGSTVYNSQQLVVNGSIISLAQNGSRIYFNRSLTQNSIPAEVVNYQPKFLVLLRGLLTQSYTVQREIGPDEIPSAVIFPSPTALPSPSVANNQGSSFRNPHCVYSIFNILNVLNVASDTNTPC